MTAIEMKTDLSALIAALTTGDSVQIIAASRAILQHENAADVLIGRIGLIAAHGDTDGQTILTLAAAAMLCRSLHTIPHPLEGSISPGERAFPLFAQAMLAAAPAVRIGNTVQPTYPPPFFPSGLIGQKKSVSEAMREVIESNDPLMVERLMFGLYGTGADYRTLEVRVYDSISTTFQNMGHPLMMAARGFQLLDTVEWGNRAPHIIHWLAPHLPIRPEATQPDWVKTVGTFATSQAHDMSSIRKRLSAPKDTNALPLRTLILSDADTTQVCQGVYDTVMTGEASARATAAVIALAAAEVMSRVDDGDRNLFIRTAHGLLFTSAISLVFRQVQDVEVLPLLFTSASFINALQKAVAAQRPPQIPATASVPAPSVVQGGGLIAPAQLDTLRAQLQGKDLDGAFTTTRRYIKLNYDTRALFATIALVAAQVDATVDQEDQGHTLQIVQAASEQFLSWPSTLANTNVDVFIQVALRAAAFGKRNTVIAQ